MTLPSRFAARGRPSVSDGIRTASGGVLGVLLLVVLWAVMALSQPDIVLPSPGQTLDSILSLAGDGRLIRELGRTLYRAGTGVAIALIIGLVWGVINGLSKWATALSQPTVSSLMAVPPVVLVALGLIWFGPGDAVTRLVIVLVSLPLLVMTVSEAVRNIDGQLLEMTAVFQIPRKTVLRHVVVPGITSPVLAVTSVVFGQSVRVAVMSELLSSTNGIGAEVALSRTNLDTADLFAWTIAIVIVVILLETLILRPVTAHLLRWRAQ